MGRRLYNWEDDGEFIQWLKNHPTSSVDEIMNLNFTDNFATWQNNEVAIDLATLVDDINSKNVFGMNFDGT